LRPPEDLVRIGFERSPIVIVNECHDGMRRCRRTREIGRRLLQPAHIAGVRCVAMEALTPDFAAEAVATRQLPVCDWGYLGQPDMRDLIGDVLALGWDLLAYECDFERAPARDHRSLEFANWRDAEEARHVAEFLAESAPGTRLLVWCGNSHQRKTPQQYHSGGTWIRLGQRLAELTGIDPFVIDQSVTVDYHGPGSSRRAADVEPFRTELAHLGGTAGFLREDEPDPGWREDRSADAYVLSLDNAME
jgi:hypothetical protein